MTRRYSHLEAVDPDEAATDLARVEARRAAREREAASKRRAAQLRAYTIRRKPLPGSDEPGEHTARVEAALVALEERAELARQYARYAQVVEVVQRWWARRAA